MVVSRESKASRHTVGHQLLLSNSKFHTGLLGGRTLLMNELKRLPCLGDLGANLALKGLRQIMVQLLKFSYRLVNMVDRYLWNAYNLPCVVSLALSTAWHLV